MNSLPLAISPAVRLLLALEVPHYGFDLTHAAGGSPKKLTTVRFAVRQVTPSGEHQRSFGISAPRLLNQFGLSEPENTEREGLRMLAA